MSCTDTSYVDSAFRVSICYDRCPNVQPWVPAGAWLRGEYLPPGNLVKYFVTVIRSVDQLFKHYFHNFYSASALLAKQSAVLARGILSVRPSVCLSVRHVPVLCPDE